MIRRVLLILVLSLSGSWLVRTFLYEAVRIASGSMEPTLPVETHYLVNRWVYYFQPPKRGDIIVFKSPVNQEKGLIKRVIGVPGDQVEIRSKQIYLNGQYVSEPYTIHSRANERLVGDNISPPPVPPGSVFVLGDNRDESEDSSQWRDPSSGERIYFVKIKEIEGRLIQP